MRARQSVVLTIERADPNAGELTPDVKTLCSEIGFLDGSLATFFAAQRRTDVTCQ
jgi:hypothetical protein